MKGIRRVKRVLIALGLCAGLMQGCFLFPPSANFLVDVGPEAVTLEAGEAFPMTVIVTCGYLFDESVAILVSLPSGFTVPNGLTFFGQSCGGDIHSIREHRITLQVRAAAVTAGTYTVRVRGSDGDSEQHEATVTVTVGADEESPTVALIDPQSLEFTSPVSISGTAVDNAGIARITRSLDGGPEVDLTGWTDNPPNFSGSIEVAPGTHTLVVRAYDPSGNIGSATREFTLNGPGNDPPSVSISSPDDNSMFVTDQTVTLVGSATDPEDGTLPGSGLVWTSNADGELGMGPEISVMGLSVGTHIITLTATDSQGASATATVTIHVTETGPSECSLFNFVLAPDELSVPIGGSNSTAITLTRSVGFTAPVIWTLNSASGASLEFIFDTRDFDPPVSTENMTTLTLTPGVEASAGGSFQLLVRGQSEVPSATCTQPLTVTFVDP